MNQSNHPPKSEAELLTRCQRIQSLTVGQLAARLSITIPQDPVQCKGLIGLMLERVLGTTASNQALPDFTHLNIELKTLPIGFNNKPVESTFITSIPLTTIHQQQWETSTCWLKLKRILWVPVELDPSIPLIHRRFGQGFIWSPTEEQCHILKQDWLHLTAMIALGQILEIDAKIGTYLQIRPKAAHGQVLCDAFDAEGNLIKTLPRGFYLRRIFTEQIWRNPQ